MTDTETESPDEAEVQDEGWVSPEEAMQAVEEEMERQIAAASGESEADGPTSVTEAQETPEEPLLGEAGGDGDGSGGSEEADDLSADLQLGGDDGTDDAGLLTPEQLGEMGGSQDSLEEQLDDLGGDTGGEVPGMGDLGGAQPSGQPSVADGNAITYTHDADGTDTTTTHYGGSGPDANGNFISHSITVRPSGDTSETFRVNNVDGSGFSYTVNRDGDGMTTSTVHTKTDDDLRETVTQAEPEGVIVIETDPQGDTQITTHIDDVTEVDTDPGFDPASTDDPGPDGGEVVPGGRNEANQEDLEEMAGPTDAGPGNVDPAEYDDGAGDGQQAQGPQPGVDNPPDEGETTGGGEPIDSSGWDVDPAEEDDFGGEKGPEQSPADAFDAPRPVLDADDVVPQGDAEPAHPATARPTVAEPLLSRSLDSDKGGGRGSTDDDLGDGRAESTPRIPPQEGGSTLDRFMREPTEAEAAGSNPQAGDHLAAEADAGDPVLARMLSGDGQPQGVGRGMGADDGPDKFGMAKEAEADPAEILEVDAEAEVAESATTTANPDGGDSVTWADPAHDVPPIPEVVDDGFTDEPERFDPEPDPEPDLFEPGAEPDRFDAPDLF